MMYGFRGVGEGGEVIHKKGYKRITNMRVAIKKHQRKLGVFFIGWYEYKVTKVGFEKLRSWGTLSGV